MCLDRAAVVIDGMWAGETLFLGCECVNRSKGKGPNRSVSFGPEVTSCNPNLRIAGGYL